MGGCHPPKFIVVLKACRTARLRQGEALVAQIDVPDRNTETPGIAAMGRSRAAACVLAALFAAALGSCAKPPEVDVVMVDYRFIPDHLTFEHDVRYRLHLENHGKETHEFTAPTFFATADIDNPGYFNRERSEILMQPGDAKDIYLTPRRPGTYDLRCADHDWAGMVGGITVK